MCLPVLACLSEVRGTLQLRTLRLVPAFLHAPGDGALLRPGHAAVDMGLSGEGSAEAQAYCCGPSHA